MSVTIDGPADFPALFRSADRESQRAQRSYLTSLRVRLGSLVLAAFGGALTLTTAGGFQVGGGLAFLAFACALGAELFLATTSPLTTWYEGRAAAESAKTLAWRYMVRADSSCIRHDRLSGCRAIDGRFVVHTFLWKKTLLIHDEEEYEARDHDHRREHYYDQYGGERASRGRCCRESQIRRQHVRPLRYTPPEDDARDRDDGEQAGAAGSMANQQNQGYEPADYRKNDQCQSSRSKAVKEVAGISAQYEDADKTDDTDDAASDDRPTPEVVRHIARGEAAGVPDQIDRGEVRHGRHRQDTGNDRSRVDPAVHWITGLTASGYPTGGNAT